MRLVEQYLEQVGRHLSEEVREDILSELRSSIEEELLELGDQGDLDDQQQALVIERYGHPIKVAAAYRAPQYLIGPELFPAFVQTLYTVFTVSIIGIICLHMLSWATRGSVTHFSNLIGNGISLSLWSGAIVVVSFVILEQCGERLDWYDNWRASSLRSFRAINRNDLMTNVITEGVFLLWWNSAFSFQQWIPGFGRDFTVSLSSTWATLFWPINIVVGAWFILHAVTLLRDGWSRSALWLELLCSAVAIALIMFLLLQTTLISYTGGVDQFDILQRSLRVTLIVIAALIIWDAYLAMKRLRTF